MLNFRPSVRSARDRRPDSIGADHDGGLAFTGRAIAVLELRSDNTTPIPQQGTKRELLAYLGSRLARRLDQQLVKHCTARRKHDRCAFDSARPAANRDGPIISSDAMDWWTSRCRQRLEQPPFREERSRPRPHEVRRDSVAGKMCVIDAENP
jgi:hypothetical protein